MRPTQVLYLFTFALVLAAGTVLADDGLHGAQRLGEHPAVLVARRGVTVDPTTKFYMHPARLSWSLTRPLAEGEHPAVLVAHHGPSSAIDPNRFILGHPAGGSFSPRDRFR